MCGGSAPEAARGLSTRAGTADRGGLAGQGGDPGAQAARVPRHGARLLRYRRPLRRRAGRAAPGARRGRGGEGGVPGSSACQCCRASSRCHGRAACLMSEWQNAPATAPCLCLSGLSLRTSAPSAPHALPRARHPDLRPAELPRCAVCDAAPAHLPDTDAEPREALSGGRSRWTCRARRPMCPSLRSPRSRRAWSASCTCGASGALRRRPPAELLATGEELLTFGAAKPLPDGCRPGSHLAFFHAPRGGSRWLDLVARQCGWSVSVHQARVGSQRCVSTRPQKEDASTRLPRHAARPAAVRQRGRAATLRCIAPAPAPITGISGLLAGTPRVATCRASMTWSRPSWPCSWASTLRRAAPRSPAAWTPGTSPRSATRRAARAVPRPASAQRCLIGGAALDAVTARQGGAAEPVVNSVQGSSRPRALKGPRG